jgi:divalent metal cation (Fe/Co/Zn/Cd) transporter
MSGAHETEQVQRRTLLLVLFMNALLFVGLGVGGIAADSSALLANARTRPFT